MTSITQCTIRLRVVYALLAGFLVGREIGAAGAEQRCVGATKYPLGSYTHKEVV